MGKSKKKHKAKKKPTINLQKLLAQALVDLIIGFILLLIGHYLFG